MKNYFLTGALFFCVSFFSSGYAQVYGTMGDIQISQSFVNALQEVNPDFAFSPNADIFRGSLQKYFIQNKSYSNAARLKGLDKDPEVKKQIDLIKQLAEDKYLAQLYMQHQNDSVKVSEAETRTYYNTHISEFSIPGQYSYLHAIIFDTSVASIQSVKQKMETYSKDESILDEFKMGSKQSYLISFEKNRTIYPYSPESVIFKSLPVKAISEPVRSAAQIDLYCIISGTPEKIQSYDEVKDLCKNYVMRNKMAEIDGNLKKGSYGKYPISLNTNYFGK